LEAHIHFHRARQPSFISESACAASPDFLSRLVALANFMRLSLRKAAHAAISGAAWQEIRFGLLALGRQSASHNGTQGAFGFEQAGDSITS
jgi:hypothetical protein